MVFYPINCELKGVKTDGSGNKQWNRNYGGEINERAYSLVEVSNGGFALAGYTSSFGAGDYDIWLVKTDEQGVPEFPSWTLLLVALTAVAVAGAIYKRRLLKTMD